MADVIGLQRKKREKQLQTDQEKARKVQAFLKVFECASCHLKCARCGTQLELSRVQSLVSGMPYRFCRSCENEFAAFQKRLKGNTENDIYWYNEEWLEMWKAWTRYQDAVKRFLNSKEVIRLR
jgi:hypothetical protein